jgi:exodeoxyribonuclease V alpha subunit
MQIKNNYKLEWEIVSKYHIPIDKGMGVFNGDTGIIREINTYAETVTVEYDEHKRVTYPYAGLDELELAYAITVHKSQGSEYPAIIMPLLGVPKMLTYRNLFYTAVTRAKNCVTLLGSRDTIEQMINNAREQERYSGLQQRILEAAN